MAVRDICLQNNPGLHLSELWRGQYVHEGINGEFKIAELFHVEVHKSVGCCGRCRTIKVAESFFNPL